MAAATVDERRLMAEDVEALEEQYKLGALAMGLARAISPMALLTGPILAQVPFFMSDEQEKAAGLLAHVQPQLHAWRDRYRLWAEAGRRDDGSSYDVTRWRAFGVNLGSQIEQATGQALQGSMVGVAKNLASDVAAQGRAAADFIADAVPTQDTLRGVVFWAKVAGGLAGLFGAAYLVRSFK